MAGLVIRANAIKGLKVENGTVNVLGMEKHDAEKLMADIAATMISSSGSPRSGYLRMRVDNDGNLRFTASHWSRTEKASAANLMLALAKKAWGTQSVDAKALQNYLRSPNHASDRAIPAESQQLGTKSLVKLLANRFAIYSSIAAKAAEAGIPSKEQSPTSAQARSDQPASRLQAYADRFLKGDSRHPGGRLQLDQNSADRASENVRLTRAMYPTPALSRAGPKSVAAALELVNQAVAVRHESMLGAYALACGVELNEDNRGNLDRSRLEATVRFQSNVLERQQPGSARFKIEGTEVTYAQTHGRRRGEPIERASSEFLAPKAVELGLKGLDDWKFAKPSRFGSSDKVSDVATRVLLDGYATDIGLAYSGEQIKRVQDALSNLQSSFKQNVFMPPHEIEQLVVKFQTDIGESKPDPLHPDTIYSAKGIASIAFHKVIGFVSRYGSKFSSDSLVPRPTPLDYALMGITGVNSVNFGPINEILCNLPKGSLDSNADPHPALVIQNVVNAVNEKLTGPFVQRYRWVEEALGSGRTLRQL